MTSLWHPLNDSFPNAVISTDKYESVTIFERKRQIDPGVRTTERSLSNGRRDICDCWVT